MSSNASAAGPRDAGHSARASGRATGLALALLALLLLQGIVFMTESSQTSDEAAHLLAGYTYLTTGDFRPNREEPPLIKELAALPLLFLDLDRPSVDPESGRGVFRLGPAFVHENRVPADTLLLLGRLPILMLSLLLGWTIFRWGLDLFGARGALLALALYVLDPNVVANSCLVTTDIGVTLFMALTLFCLWRWAGRPRPIVLIASGLALGAALASKATAVWILPVVGSLSLPWLRGAGDLPARPWSSRSVILPPGAPLRDRLAALVLAGVVLFVAALLVVGLVCGVRGLPDYFAGLVTGLGHSASGHTAYLMGETSAHGFWSYFLVAFLIKTPPGTLLLIAAAIVMIGRGGTGSRKDAIVLAVPIIMIVLITCVWRVNIGLRHLLPIYPFLFLFTGRLAGAARAGSAAGPRWAAGLLGGFIIVCLGWNGVEAARIAPYHLAYFNEFIGGPRNGHLYLLDSNLDWGQDFKTLRRWQLSAGAPVVYLSFTGAATPAYSGVRYQYVPGIGNFEDARTRGVVAPENMPRDYLVVSATSLHFVRLGQGTLYDWLKDRPVVAAPGYAFFVYDITGDAQAHARLARLYLEQGVPELASSEEHRATR